jgi:hypothetical protein
MSSPQKQKRLRLDAHTEDQLKRHFLTHLALGWTRQQCVDTASSMTGCQVPKVTSRLHSTLCMGGAYVPTENQVEGTIQGVEFAEQQNHAPT